MKNNSMIIALLGGLALLAVSCMKVETINEMYRPAGSEIVFGAATSYDNGEATRTEYDAFDGPATRTDYSGAIYGSSPKVERIDWVSNDEITIFYKQGSAAATSGDYGVTTITTQLEKSYADIENIAGTKLTWGDGTDDHYFYAMYPSHEMNSNASLTNTSHVSGVIPATQDINTAKTITVDGVLKYQPDMMNAYMVSYKKIAASSTTTRAELPFTPAVTTFEFKFQLNENDTQDTRTVTKFTMEASTDLTGKFDFDITGGTDERAEWGTVTTDNAGKMITVNFPSDGYTMTKDAWLDFSVLALPIQQENVKITFYFKEADGATYHKSVVIKKNNQPATFAAAKKHIITNDKLTGEIITYTFEVTPTISTNYLGKSTTYTVTSYRQIGSTGAKQGVRWDAISYSVNGGAATTTKPVWLPTFKAANTPSNENPVNHDVVISPADRHNPGIEALENADPRGTETDPWDLSLHNINGGVISKTTANCYVITAPGWYKFPLVYGNAYKGGSDNTDSYKHTLSSYDSHYLKNFKDANNNNISSPDISGITRVALQWQDAQDLVTVDDLKLEDNYVIFHIEKEHIREGNAVIAAYKGNTIFWSWHIWVTPYVKSNVTIKGKTYMARNVGWCEGGTTTWEARNVVITFKQKNSNYTRTLTITQTGNTETVLGSGPHYQWGRKDPMIPPIGLSYATQYAANKIWYNASGVASQNVTTKPAPQTIGYGIQNPMTMIYDNWQILPTGGGHNYCDWLGVNTAWESNDHFCNLWNYNVNKNGTATVGLKVTDYNGLAHGKTVYDPCPIGYTIPTPYEIANLATFKASSWLDGYTLYNTNPGTFTKTSSMVGYEVSGNFWAANGMRMYVNGDTHVANVGRYGYWFSSGASNSHMALALLEYTPDYPDGAGRAGFTIDGSYAKGSARSIRCVPE